MSLVLCRDPTCEICAAQRQGLMVPPRVAEETIAILRQESVIRMVPVAEGDGEERP